MDRPNVFTIPPGARFLDTLVDALLGGRLIQGFDARAPFALADTTIYLPTRRAARAIRESFLSKLGRPLFLPKIRTLGDLDEDEAGLADLDAADLPAAVPPMERQLVLTKLVLAWSGALVRSQADFPEEELIVPASPADAARLAASLGALLDQVGGDPQAWRGLFAERRAELAKYWHITLEFLKIVTDFWPEYLAERRLIDAGSHRDALIVREAERLIREGSGAPVIAAGSTGSVKATAILLAAIARLPNGAVVLPGLDQHLDEESWNAIEIAADEPTAAGHPQYGLKAFLQAIGAPRDSVIPLTQTEGPLRFRARFVSEAMRPASTVERWREPSLGPDDMGQAVSAMGIIEAANERDEALSIAVLLRGAAETPGRIAALITPDRGLARRVAVELKRWDIDVDDSAGRPLGQTPPGTLARLVAEAALNGCAAETLLSLLKHPLAGFGQPPSETRWAARNLERAALRGPRLNPGMAALRHALALRFAEAHPPEGTRKRKGAARVSERRCDSARELAERVETALASLERIAANGARVPLSELVDAHLAAAVAVASAGSHASRLFADEAGEALASFFQELRAGASSGPEIPPSDYPGLFSALIERVAVRRRGGLDPRIHIWGALEARLQSVDVTVLGAMNEGIWPAQARLDPLLSRPMREALALDPPERRIGLAAHDFAQALGHKQVWITRSDRQNGEPRVASRWLQRLTAYAGPELAGAMRARGAEVLSWARSLDATPPLDRPVRPRPSPSPELRPKQLSATRIETLIRDPYAIYAREILKLRPLEPLAKLPDAAERGTLIHDILEEFVRERPAGPFDPEAERRLLSIGEEAFARHRDFPEMIALWWPRFERIARWFVRMESGWADVAERRVECTGTLQINAGFLLTTRADRLDALRGGGLAIIDYKTGAPPTLKEVRSLSPQLPLEALVAQRGGFEGIAAADAQRIVYYRLHGRGDGGELCDRSEAPGKKGVEAISLTDTLAITERRLNELIAHFQSDAAEYVSQKIPKPGRRTFVGDYDHLARISEWVATDLEDLE